MVSYYNALPYSQKHNATNLTYSASQPWQWPANYHGPPSHQFLSEIEPPHTHHQMYYNTHMFHTTAGATPEWHAPSPAAESLSQNVGNSLHIVQNHITHSSANGNASSAPATSDTNLNDSSSVNNTRINKPNGNIGHHHITCALPSPPITISGSEISSPDVPPSVSSPNHVPRINNTNNNNPAAASQSTISQSNLSTPGKAQYYEWMKKPSYSAQPAPGKTRTKDKYRVVYTDYQRLELEKEYCTSRYITIRRKTELAQTLSLSERQVKIWFQNRRAKERKQNKKNNDPSPMSGIIQHVEYPNLMQAKPKLEPGLHLQHSFHSMSSMAAMGLHHLGPHHSATVTHQIHQPHSQHSSSVSSLPM